MLKLTNSLSKISLFTSLFVLLMISFSCKEMKSKKTTENSKEWKKLFNGNDLNDWVVKIHHHELGDNYKNTFRVIDHKIQINYDDYDKFEDRFGHLFYKKSFSSFHLKFQYRFTNQWLNDAPSFTYRNSGVMFHSQDPKTILKEQNWPISIEYQLLADADDNMQRATGNMCSPGTEVFIDQKMTPQHCVQSSSKRYQWDEWVSGEIIVYKDSLIQHIVNGKKVLEYSKPQIGGEVIKGHNPAVKIDGKLLTKGYIGLQSEGQGIEFKEILIKSLDE